MMFDTLIALNHGTWYNNQVVSFDVIHHLLYDSFLFLCIEDGNDYKFCFCKMVSPTRVVLS